jgi:alpha-tubulin suppressor-like RCC1 family protein
MTGSKHTCGISETPVNPGGFEVVRTVFCWGENENRQLAKTDTIDRYTANTVEGLKGDPRSVEPPLNPVGAGGGHTCASLIDDDRTVNCWGQNAEGELGDGTTQGGSTPVTVKKENATGPLTDLTGVTSVAAGFEHTCALLANKSIWCWGNNTAGQLGNGITGGISLGAVQVIKLQAIP